MRGVRAAVLVAAGAIGLTWIAACEEILGLDENLTEQEGNTVQQDGSISDGDAQDATRDGAPGVDAASDDAPGDAATLPRPWAVDTTFHDGGALVLDLSTNYAAAVGTLELLGDPDAGSLIVVGLGTKPPGSAQVLFIVPVSDGDAGAGAPIPLAGPPSCYLLGAFASGSARSAILEDENDDVYVYDVAADAGYSQQPPLRNDGGALIARLVATVNGGDFVGPATVGDASVEATVTPLNVMTSPPTVDGSSPTVLAEGLGSDGTWFGGYSATPPLQTAVLVPPAGSLLRLVDSATETTGSAVTDFAQTTRGLFAVGYIGDEFAVWPAVADAGAVRTIEVAGKVPFSAGRAFLSSYPYSFVRTTVSADQKIVASGAFDSAYLATFDELGEPPDLLVQPDGSSASSIDLADLLTATGAGGGARSWYPGSVLATGDDLYATFASAAPGAQWFVVRLRRRPAP